MTKILIMVFNNQDAIAALVFCASAVVGQVLHSVKKWLEGDSAKPFTWITSDLRHTVAAMIGNVGGMIVFIQTGVLGPIAAQPNGWWALFLFGFMNGFSFDSGLNRATADAEKKP